MHTTWMRLWGMVAVVLLLAPLLAVCQPRPREARQTAALIGLGANAVINDWRDNQPEHRSDNQERLGASSIRPGENVVLQDQRERIRDRPNYKIPVGDGGDWVDVGQIGQFRNGTWYVNCGMSRLPPPLGPPCGP